MKNYDLIWSRKEKNILWRDYMWGDLRKVLVNYNLDSVFATYYWDYNPSVHYSKTVIRWLNKRIGIDCRVLSSIRLALISAGMVTDEGYLQRKKGRIPLTGIPNNFTKKDPAYVDRIFRASGFIKRHPERNLAKPPK